MIAWQRLTFGTLVMAGIAITGVTIYQGAARRQVKPIDVIEIIDGAQERWAALQTGTALVYRVVTNQVDVWSADPAGLQYQVPNGTNAPGWTNYLTWSASTNYVTTNLYLGFEHWQTFPRQVGRFVWGGWDAYQVAGFEDYYGDTPGLNGTYHRATQTVWGVIYTNLPPAGNGVWVYVLVDRGPDVGWILDTAYADSTNDPPVSWYFFGWPNFQTTDHRRRSFAGTWSGGYHTGTVTPVGAVVTNHIRDCSAWVNEPAMNAIGLQVPRGLLAELDTVITNMIPSYVDDTLMSNGTFDAWFAVNSNATTFPRLTQTGLWARLGIGDRTNRFTSSPGRTEPARTNWVYAYTNWWPDHTNSAVCYTAEVWHAVNYASAWDGTNYTWGVYSGAVPVAVAASNVPATYGAYPMVISTNDLAERCAVLQALRVTAPQTCWTNSGVTNVNWGYDARLWDGNELSNAVAAARDQYTSGVNLTVGLSGYPREETVNGDYVDPDFFMSHYYASVRSEAWMIGAQGNPMGMTNAVQFYARIVPPGPVGSVSNSWTFMQYSQSFAATGREYCIDSGTFTGATPIASGWIGNTGLPIPTPHTTNDYGLGTIDKPLWADQWGWMAEYPLVLSRWQFAHCTNAP